jgi:HlyD family secretion protein
MRYNFSMRLTSTDSLPGGGKGRGFRIPDFEFRNPPPIFIIPNIQFMRAKRFLASILFPALVFSACGNDGNDFDASGIFEADEVIISAEVPGKLLQFDIEEGARLEKGQQVGLIDCKQLELQKAQVEAGIEAVRQKQNDAGPQTAVYKEQLSVQQKQIAALNEQLRVLEKEQVRLERLVAAEAAPVKQLDDLNGQVDILKKQIEAAESQTEVVRQQIRSQQQAVSIVNRGILSEQKPMQQQIALLDDQIRRCTLTNPVEGTVLLTYAEENEMAAPGKPLYKIADFSTLDLRAYVSGDQHSQLKLNQDVSVLVDEGASGYREYPGSITWISEKAEFTPKTIQTKEERANLVYAIKIRVINDGYLKIGMYGEVKLGIN